MYYLKSTEKDYRKIESLIVKCRGYALYQFQRWNEYNSCLYINIEIYILNLEKSIGRIKEMLFASCHVDTAVCFSSFCCLTCIWTLTQLKVTSPLMSGNFFLFFLFKCDTIMILHVIWELYGDGRSACNSPVAVLLARGQRTGRPCVQVSDTPEVFYAFIVGWKSHVIQRALCFQKSALCDVTKVLSQVGHKYLQPAGFCRLCSITARVW